jgi:hypothetical protein
MGEREESDMNAPHQADMAAAARRLAVLNARLLAGGIHLDSNETAILDRELRAIEAKVLLVEYAELKHRRFIPVDNAIDPGAESIWFRELDYRGEAKIIANFADDLPRVDVSRDEAAILVKSVGDSFTYSELDLRRAAFSGVPLDAMKARAARDIMERKLDTIACFGDSASGLKGLLNHSSVSVVTAQTAGGKVVWTDKTPDQIVADVSYLMRKIVVDTLELHNATAVLFPTSLFQLISMTRMGDGTNVTIRQFLEGNHPGVAFESWTRLNTANAGGTAGRIMAYQRDPMVVQHKIPLEYTQLPPERRNMAWVVNAWARTAGVQLYRPKAALYMDGAE